MSATPRVQPTFAALPETLKKRIVLFLKEFDEAEREGEEEDDCGDCCGGGSSEDHHGHNHSHEAANKKDQELNDLEKITKDISLDDDKEQGTNVGNLSLINKDWHKICCSFIWKSPDLAEKSLESLLYFEKNFLPKYSQFIDSLFLIQNVEILIEEEDSPFKFIEGTSDDEREKKVVEQVEKVCQVEKPRDEQIRQRRARSLILAEIVKTCPQLVKIEFDCPELEEEEEEEEEEEKVDTELRDYVLDALKLYANSFKSLSHIGYTLNPVSTSSYEDAASLISTFSTQLRSIRLDCASAPGDSQAILNALSSVERLESLDLSDSDFQFDFSKLGGGGGDGQNCWPLRRLVLGEFLELSTEQFSTLINRFSSTLEILHIEGCPTFDEEEPGSEKKEIKAFNTSKINKLPKLVILEISTNHSVKILNWLTPSAHSPSLRELRIGFCPNFDVDQLVEYLEKNRDKLEYFELDVTCFGMEEVAKLGAVSEELDIKFQLVSTGGFDDEFMGGGDFDDDEEGELEDQEWEDEDDE